MITPPIYCPTCETDLYMCQDGFYPFSGFSVYVCQQCGRELGLRLSEVPLES